VYLLRQRPHRVPHAIALQTTVFLLGVLPSACDAAPATPSDSIVVPYQFNIESALEADGEDVYVARARFYDIAQA
jgi:hypothetical protein